MVAYCGNTTQSILLFPILLRLTPPSNLSGQHRRSETSVSLKSRPSWERALPPSPDNGARLGDLASRTFRRRVVTRTTRTRRESEIVSSRMIFSTPLPPPLLLCSFDAAGSICFSAIISVNDSGRGHENIGAIPFPLTPSFPLCLSVRLVGVSGRVPMGGGTGRSSVSRHSRCTLTTLLCFITLHQMLP